ncbi:unnamed protein product [Linum tenue]|uniref:Gnk2-homologous domain-containing protein n=2 Tax=Linum tenue TaxID=586396 RepID=A0AAV0J634_9ROSI|nr:unnamed protein product [Linum tenue]
MDRAMSKLAVLAVLLFVGLSSFAEARHGNSTVVRGPSCSGWTENKLYSKNVANLIDKLVDETRKVHRERGDEEDYRYTRDFPANCHSGTGATGGATCDKQLGNLDCWGCLLVAKNKFKSGNCDDNPIRGAVQLRDCSMWFRKYHSRLTT